MISLDRPRIRPDTASRSLAPRLDDSEGDRLGNAMRTSMSLLRRGGGRLAFKEAKALYDSGVQVSREANGDGPLDAIALFVQAANVFGGINGHEDKRDKSLWQAAMCYGRIGWNLKRRRDWTGASKAFQEALRIFESIQDVEQEANTLYQLALVSSDVLTASDLLKRAALIYSDLENDAKEAMCLAELGNLFASRRAQDVSASLVYWQQALILYVKVGDQGKEARALYSIGEVLARSEQRRAAYDHFLQARAVLAQLSNKDDRDQDDGREETRVEWLARCNYRLGKLCVAEKLLSDAVKYLEERFNKAQACELFRQVGFETDEAWTMYRLALVMLKVEATDLAVDYLNEARRLFARAGGGGGTERQHAGETKCLSRLAASRRVSRRRRRSYVPSKDLVGVVEDQSRRQDERGRPAEEGGQGARSELGRRVGSSLATTTTTTTATTMAAGAMDSAGNTRRDNAVAAAAVPVEPDVRVRPRDCQDEICRRSTTTTTTSGSSSSRPGGVVEGSERAWWATVVVS